MLLFALLVLAAAKVSAVGEPPIRIGYAVSLSGSNAAGAGISTVPNYRLWSHDVNAAGGILLPDGSRRLVAFVEYDTGSSIEELKRLIERLALHDDVDFLLPPWGTGPNIEVAPLFDQLGYPQLSVTAVTEKAPEFASLWPRSFWMLGGGTDYTGALAKLLADARDSGKINDKIALLSVADGFGIDLVTAARAAFSDHGFELVYDRTYPLGRRDFRGLITGAMASGADSFVSLSYPPDTFAVTGQAQSLKYNPKVFYVGVGASFPVYPAISGGNMDGVMSLGGVDTRSEAILKYFERHTEVTGGPPDSWASAVTYASLEMLQQAIERHGLDRNAVSQELANGRFQTVLGSIRLEDNQLRDLWLVGQWQHGSFTAIAPAERSGVAFPVIPKAAWQ